MPSAASSTAKKSGVKASKPDTSASRAPTRSPAATERSAWMQIAVMSGVTTRKPTTVGTAASASVGVSS